MVTLITKSDTKMVTLSKDVWNCLRRLKIEDMMFGLPVIANGIATIPTIIQHGETGFVLKQNTPEEIANYIIKLQDKILREKMGEMGRKRFLIEYEIKKYENKFIKILKAI